jgi:hypothetical protein
MAGPQPTRRQGRLRGRWPDDVCQAPTARYVVLLTEALLANFAVAPE